MSGDVVAGAVCLAVVLSCWNGFDGEVNVAPVATAGEVIVTVQDRRHKFLE